MKVFAYIFIVISVGLLSNCKKEVISPDQPKITDPFSFYPNKDAIWVIKSYQVSPVSGVRYDYWDTLYFGNDTTMESRTLFHGAKYWAESDPLSMKKYSQILGKSMTTSSDGYLFYNKYRHGWFRQNEENQTIYTPRINSNENIVYEDLRADFGLEVGDTAWFLHVNARIVLGYDSILFGDKYLKVLNYGSPDYPNVILGHVTQALDYYARTLYIGNGYGGPSGNFEWKKLIHQSDTLIHYY